MFNRRYRALAAVVFSFSIGDAFAAEPAAPPPLWTWELGIDGVYGARNNSTGTPIASDFVSTFFDSREFDFDREFGGDVRLRLRREAWTFEGRYFGGFSFGSDVGGIVPPAYNLLSNPPETLFPGGVFPTVNRYDSRLHSAEANVRWQAAPNVTYFAGARWLKLNEYFSFDRDNLQTRSATQAIGPQIGVDWRALQPAPSGGLFVDVDARLGWLFADHSASSHLFAASARGSADRSLLAAEAGITLGWLVSPNAEWRLGYRALWLDNVALAPSQLPGTNFTAGTINIARDDYLVHGVTFGFVVRH